MKKVFSFAICFVLLFALCLVGCNQSTGKVADNTEHLDTITKSCKLTKDYEGKSFLTDGIGEATISHYTDGDTLGVVLKKEGTSVTIRFHSVDTPESTGGVEKWGKAASLFVKQQLEKATGVVVEATAVPAEHDNYGVRYLGYIWYRTSDTEDYRNLNLELVENGYSKNHGNDTSKFPYNSYFKKAEQNSRAIKLRLFSDKADPLYSTDPVDVTIKEIFDNIDQYYNAETDSGSKVRFNAYLESVTVSGSGTYTFIAKQYDAETGKMTEIPVYAGYASSAASGMKVGHLYRVVGVIQMHNSKLQISGVTYNSIFGASNPEYTHPIQTGYYLTFSSSFAFDTHFNQTLYSDVTVVNASVTDGVLTIEGTANPRTKADEVGEAKTFTFKVNAPEGYQDAITEGKTFSVNGYQFEENSGVITILNYSDIILK